MAWHALPPSQRIDALNVMALGDPLYRWGRNMGLSTVRRPGSAITGGVNHTAYASRPLRNCYAVLILGKRKPAQGGLSL